MKVFSPVKNASGVWANTVFINGMAECTDPYLLEWFLNNGYRLEFPQSVIDGKVTVDESKVANDNIDPNELSALELREWMLARGYGSIIKNTKNKKKLLEIYYGDSNFYANEEKEKIEQLKQNQEGYKHD